MNEKQRQRAELMKMKHRTRLYLTSAAAINAVLFLFWGSYVMFEVIMDNEFHWWEPPVIVLIAVYFMGTFISFPLIWEETK